MQLRSVSRMHACTVFTDALDGKSYWDPPEFQTATLLWLLSLAKILPTAARTHVRADNVNF